MALSNRKKIFFTTFVVGVFGVMLLIGAELWLAVFHPQLPAFLRPDQILGTMHFSNYTVRQDDGCIEAVTRFNNDGMNDVEHTVEKPAGTYRIAVIGDSYVEAMQFPLDQAYFRVLERRLKAQGKNVEVLAFGVGGFGTLQAYHLLNEYALKYQPDLVILSFFTYNDVRNNSFELDRSLDMKYARLDRLCDAVRRSERSLALACNELIELVRLPSGALQDDVGVVLLSRRDEVGNRPEVLRFVQAARRLCEFVEHGRDLDSSTRLQRARSVLLELYAAGAELPFVDAPEELEWPARPGRPLWPGFGAPAQYWEVFDPYELAEPVGGHLDDDLLDVYFDVKRGLTLWEDPMPKVAAVWAWRFQFDSHWGDHAIDALRALHRACRDHG